MSQLALSVEFVELHMEGDLSSGSETTTSGLLTKNQDISNCVPFISWYCDNDNYDGNFPDIWFTDIEGTPTIHAERTVPRDYDMYIKGYVVEFDPTKVKVYQGSIPTTINYNVETPITITTGSGVFDQSRTALKFYYRAENMPNPNYLNQHLIRGQVLDNGTDLSFIKMLDVANFHYGHYYAFEAIGGDFTVHHKTGSSSSNLTYDIGDYDWHNTFVIHSYCGVYDGYRFDYSGWRAYLWGNSGVKIEASSQGYTRAYNVQTIEFNNDATASGTRYCPKITNYNSLDASTTIREFDFYGNVQNSESLTVCVAQNPTRLSNTSNDYKGGAFHAVWVISSGTKYRIERSTASYYSYPTYYIVDWNGQAPLYTSTGIASGTVTSGTCPVKSVENISSYMEDHVKVEHLSKGQDVNNCVVFRSGYCNNTSSYSYQYFHESLTYFRGNELYLERGDMGWGYNMELSVVEFYPDHVKVQQGSFIIGSNQTTTTVTIEEVDVSKTFLVFGNFFGDSENHWQYHLCSGRFSDSTTITFERGGAYTYPILGSFYVVEDLQNWWAVSHINAGPTTIKSVNHYFKDNLSERNGFALISVSTMCSNYYPYYATWRTYYHGPLFFMADKQSAGYNDRVALQIVKFIDRNKTRVHYTHTNLEGLNTSSTYSPYDSFHGKMVTPIFSNLASIGRSSTSNANSVSSVYMKVAYDESTNELVVTRNNTANVSSDTMNSVYTVCWDGYYDESLPVVDYFNYKSFIKSIEKFSHTGTDRRFYFTLTKNQDINNCIPIGTWSIGETSGVDVERFYYTFWFDPNRNDYLRMESFWAPDNGGLDLDLTVLEFDDEQVKVQSGIAYIWSGEFTTTVEIEEVIPSKAFIICYPYITDECEDDFGAVFIASKFLSGDQLYFKRSLSNGYACVNWYVIECLQDQWEVQHDEITNSTASYYTKDINIVPEHSAFGITSYCSTVNNYYPYYTFFRTYLNSDQRGIYSITANRQSAGHTSDVYFSTVCFKEYFGIYVDYVHFYFSTSEHSIAIDLGRDYNINSTIIWNGQSQPHMRTNSSSSSHVQNAFFKAVFQDSSTLQVTRNASGSYAESWGHVYILEFPMVTHSVSGVVTEKGKPVDRELRLHRTDTGEVLDYTVSSGIEGYSLCTTYSGSTYVVCLDDLGGKSYNGLIQTDVYPAVISGSFPQVEGWI